MGDAVQVEIEKKEFTCFIPGAKEPPARLLELFSTLQLMPWAFRPARGWAGFSDSGSITYLRLNETPAPAPPLPAGLEIREVRDKADMYAFSDVQCRAFLETPEAYQAWAPFLHRANENNLGRAGQYFYLAQRDGKPVGALLALDTENTTGLYALATPPAERQRGVGTALMKHAIGEALKRNTGDITLQISANSYAEKYFVSLGFATEFTASVLTRT
jgi:GNAT superfamily N-acetyltransferase